MRGERVLVRAFKNQPLVRVVWDVSKRLVYVTDEVQYQRLLAGQAALDPVGIPVEDIFRYRPEIAEQVATGRCDWRKMEPWATPGQ
jgi:hypothetical protein